MPPLHVLIVPDKFKGTLTSQRAAEAIAAGWEKARPEDRLDRLAMCDGGDGFGLVMGPLTAGRKVHTATVDSAGRPVRAAWWYSSRTRIAIIEAAAVNGLALFPSGRFHPDELDTFGLGALLHAAARRGAKRCLIGIGGSATNDGGFGLARACGWKFFDAGAREIHSWTSLSALRRIEPAPDTQPLASMKITVAVDVQNPLLGPSGCSRIYGPQKGLMPGDMARSEARLRQLARVLAATVGFDAAKIPGAGAAGGLGFGLLGFFRAEPRSGFDLFAEAAQLDLKLERADVVITGEGSLDAQTLMGKGVGEIAVRSRRLGLRCLGLAGHVQDPKMARRLFHDVRALTDVTTLDQAKAAPGRWLKKIAEDAARAFIPPSTRTLRRHRADR